MKHVLLALTEPNELLLNCIYEFGRVNGWQIEQCYDGKIPKHWFGDGILADYQNLEQFSAVKNFDSTPLISRILPPRKNVRTIRPDTQQIASMIVNYFSDRGFSRFIAVTSVFSEEILLGKPRNIVEALRQEVQSRGFSFTSCILNPQNDFTESDYGKQMRILQKCFLSVPKPFALILASSRFLSIAYRMLADMKIQVPEEVAVLSNTDDPLLTENAIVPTSYISGEFHELGSKMTGLLKLMMDGVQVPEEPMYVTTSGIISRKSTDSLALSDIRLAKAVAFCLQNYMNLIGVEDIAKTAGVSRVLLARLFQQHLGITPHAFLRKIRLNQICHLLDSSTFSLSEIAARTGYGTDMALSLAFKREFRMPPGKYRESRRR